MKKRLLIIFMSVVLLSLMAFPAYLFAEDGDTYKFTSIPFSGDDAGQYYVDPDGAGDNVEVFCIDRNHSTNINVKYTESTQTIASSITGETEQDAEALEILSTTQTGSSPVVDQVVVWNYSDDYDVKVKDNYPTTSKTIKITQEQVDEAKEIIEQIDIYAAANTDESSENDFKIEDFNQVEVVLDELPLGTDTNQDGMIESGTDEVTEHTATAVMEDPLVPGITDEGKSVYWSILEGSYNVSLKKDVLVTEIESTMSNEVDAIDATDTDGVSTIKYYYFYWGLPVYAENTMLVDLFAWVDIDEDKKLDVIDTAYQENPPTASGIVETIQKDYKAVEEIIGSSTEDIADDSVETGPAIDSFDIHQVPGGTVLISKNKQTLATKSSDEPYDNTIKGYVAGTITINKTDTDGNPLAGAVFNIVDKDNKIVAVITSDEKGIASYTGLLAGDYTVIEITAPEGYTIDNFPNTFAISLTESVEEKTLTNSLIPLYVPPSTTVTGTFDIAGIFEEAEETAGIIEVAGITELPFTGSNMIIVLIGALALSLSLILAALLGSNKKTAKNN